VVRAGEEDPPGDGDVLGAADLEDEGCRAAILLVPGQPIDDPQRWMDWFVVVVSGQDYLMKARQKRELIRMYFPLVAAQLI